MKGGRKEEEEEEEEEEEKEGLGGSSKLRWYEYDAETAARVSSPH